MLRSSRQGCLLLLTELKGSFSSKSTDDLHKCARRIHCFISPIMATSTNLGRTGTRSCFMPLGIHMIDSTMKKLTKGGFSLAKMKKKQPFCQEDTSSDTVCY